MSSPASKIKARMSQPTFGWNDVTITVTARSNHNKPRITVRARLQTGKFVALEHATSTRFSPSQTHSLTLPNPSTTGRSPPHDTKHHRESTTADKHFNPKPRIHTTTKGHPANDKSRLRLHNQTSDGLRKRN